MRLDFTKNRDHESYYVVELLVDIKTYIESRLHYPKKADDIGLKKVAEAIIVKAFKKKRFVHTRPSAMLLEGEAGQTMALVGISSIRQTLAKIEKQVDAFNLDTGTDKWEPFKRLLQEDIRKLKEKIEKLEMQALAIVDESVSA
jgi:hypothetical protein